MHEPMKAGGGVNVCTDVTWGGGGEAITLSPYFKMFMGPRNWFQGMNSARLCSLAGRYENPIPPRFPAPIDFLKIPALYVVGIHPPIRIEE